MIAKDLAEILMRNPELEVLCLAACCNHPHAIQGVAVKPDEYERRDVIVVDAKE